MIRIKNHHYKTINYLVSFPYKTINLACFLFLTLMGYRIIIVMQYYPESFRKQALRSLNHNKKIWQFI